MHEVRCILCYRVKTRIAKGLFRAQECTAYSNQSWTTRKQQIDRGIAIRYSPDSPIPLSRYGFAVLFLGLRGAVDWWSAIFGFAAGSSFARTVHGRLACLGCLRRDGGSGMAAWVRAHAQQVAQF